MYLIKNERQLWKKLKNETPQISWIRIENWALPGTPDLLGYNFNGTFFTVELKYTSAYSVRLSPHQISFHVKHPKNTFILVACTLDKGKVRLYPGSQILELENLGSKLDPLKEGLGACASQLTYHA